MSGENYLRQVEEIPGEEMPVMLIAQFADGSTVAYFDESLNSGIRLELTGRMRDNRFPWIDPLLDFLLQQNISLDVGHYKTYLFPTHSVSPPDENVSCRSRGDPKVQAFGFGGFPGQVYAIERAGKIVSACVSTRENDQSGEAWVYTDEHYRHRGFAQKVVRAWADGLIAAGKVPFYSHKIQNSASANLAKRLGLISIFEEIVIMYTGKPSPP